MLNLADNRRQPLLRRNKVTERLSNIAMARKGDAFSSDKDDLLLKLKKEINLS